MTVKMVKMEVELPDPGLGRKWEQEEDPTFDVFSGGLVASAKRRFYTVNDPDYTPPEPEERRYKLELASNGEPCFKLDNRRVFPTADMWHGHDGYTLVGFAEYAGAPPESDTPITWERVKVDNTTVMDFRLCAEIVYRRIEIPDPGLTPDD